MSLTWILGVLTLEEDFLLPVAYLFTFMVAFQGTFIFIVFVLFSKKVRKAYRKLWRDRVVESDFLSKWFGQSFTNTSNIAQVKVCMKSYLLYILLSFYRKLA